MTLPIGIEDQFIGVVDVLEKKAYVWDDTGLPENYEVQDVPADMVDKVDEYLRCLLSLLLSKTKT